MQVHPARSIESGIGLVQVEAAGHAHEMLDLDLAARIADDVVALKDGQVVAQGTADAVLTEAVLGALYDVTVRVVRDADGITIRFLD